MSFAIDTGQQAEAALAPIPKSSGVDDTQHISLANSQRAERLHRQIIENVEACDDQQMLDDYWKAEGVLLDTFYMDRPDYWQLIKDVYDGCKCYLPNAAPPPPNILNKAF
jgi:hypothetical protein